MNSAIYSGWVRHRRFWPTEHAFGYRSTLFYLDLDELPTLFEGMRLWSFNRRNLGWFRREDYLTPTTENLKEAVKTEVLRQGGEWPGGAVRLLTNLRQWGFCFNPVSFYYCFAPNSEKPSCILAQVNNTPWNERQCYLIPCNPKTGKSRIGFDKTFHVSPFNPLDMHYRWVSTAPASHLLVHMENEKDGLTHMDATLSLNRTDWSAAYMNRLLWRQPWLTLKVPVSIYWQALKLKLKGTHYYPHRRASDERTATTHITL